MPLMPCLRRLRAIASVLTEINSAAAKAGSVLADACNLLILHSASVSGLMQGASS